MLFLTFSMVIPCEFAGGGYAELKEGYIQCYSQRLVCNTKDKVSGLHCSPAYHQELCKVFLKSSGYIILTSPLSHSWYNAFCIDCI